MAVPLYDEDLTDIDMAQSTTGWSAFGGGGAGIGTGADFAIQSTLAIDKQITAADKGMMHNDATVSLGANDHIIGWVYAATPGICDLIANHGGYLAIGTGTGDFNKYAVFGNDTRPEGGNKPWVCRYSTSTPSPGAQVGTPGATPTFFGGGLNTTATAKGANLGLDAFRFGTGAYITAGDGTTPATIDGFATQDEATLNKWGLLFRQEGAYKWQGRFVVGQDNTGTATAAHFDDTESAAIFVLDTIHSQTDFTQWIIDHASTVFNCSNKVFFTLGTNNPGKVVINNASASSTGWDTCVWNDFGTIQGHVNVPYIGCSFNRTDQINQNAGTFTGCRVDSNTATSAILIDNPTLISDTTFISDGTGHAGRIRPTGAGPFSFNWDGNTDSGYAATDGSTGNETLLIDPVTASADITLTLTNGAGTPTIMEAAGYTGTFTLVVPLTTTTVTVLDARDNSPIENARVLVTAGAVGNEPFEDSVTITRSGTTASVAHTGHGLSTGEKVKISGANEWEYNCIAAISNVTTNAYDYTVNTRTNEIYRSQEFHLVWTSPGSSVIIDLVTAPDNTSTADELVEANSLGTHGLLNNNGITYTATEAYTLSCYVKENTRDRIRLDLAATRFPTNSHADFLLDSVTTDLGSGADSATIVNVGNGWYRCSVTATCTSNGTSAVDVKIYLHDGTGISYTGDGSSSVYLWGAQLEENDGPTLYIPTTTTAVSSPVTPATGTITATGVIIDGLTNASGIISDNRTYSADQSIGGNVRRGSATPYFRPSPPLAGTIDATDGLSLTVQLGLDE